MFRLYSHNRFFCAYIQKIYPFPKVTTTHTTTKNQEKRKKPEQQNTKVSDVKLFVCRVSYVLF